MQKYITLTFLLCFGSLVQAQEIVSIGAGYSQETYYSLPNGSLTSQAYDDWDLAFQIEGFAASIRVNAVKGMALYKVPALAQSDWANVDTAGMSAWTSVYDSDASWSLGAFNQGIEAGNDFDLGWGTYDPLTHIVSGDSLFVLMLADGSAKKLKIDQLSSGVYTFTYANLDGSSETTRGLDKADFVGKAFGYYAFAQDSMLDREPLNADWDLVFHRYITNLAPGVYYGVSGVQTNAGLSVAKLQNIDLNTVSLADTSNGFSTNISTIGYDWKSFDFATGWSLEDSLTYFVKARDGEIYQLTFTDFGGSANGDFTFTKSNLSTAIESDIDGLSHFQLYPNPCAERLNVVFELEKATETQLFVRDLQGRTVHQISLGRLQGFQQIQLQSLSLPAGIYSVELQIGNQRLAQKLIVR
ncbi:MAG: T9SS type A sorting domain-containing protein [Bacteroidia bacterium]